MSLEQQPSSPKAGGGLQAPETPTLAALRKTASEVNLQDSLDGGEALIRAAAEIAAERNLRHSPVARDGSPFQALRDPVSTSRPTIQTAAPVSEPQKTVRIVEPQPGSPVAASAAPTAEHPSLGRSSSPDLKGSSRRGGGAASSDRLEDSTRSEDTDVATLKALASANKSASSARPSSAGRRAPATAPTASERDASSKAAAAAAGAGAAAAAAEAAAEAQRQASANRDRAAYLKKTRSRPAVQSRAGGGAEGGKEDEDDDTAFTGRSSTRSSLRSQTSDVSKKLMASMDRGIINTSSLLDARQEALFLSMRRVAPASAAPLVHRPSSSSSSSSASSSSRATGRGASKGKSAAEIREIADRLGRPTSAPLSAKDRRADPTLKFLLFEEAAECHFGRGRGRGRGRGHGGGGSASPEGKRSSRSRSRGKGKGGRSDDDDDDDREKESSDKAKAATKFYDRMMSQEEQRRQELLDKEAKAKYDALQDKRFCPSCNATQKFSEVQEKKDKCPQCHVPYRRGVTWAQVSKTFFSKEKTYAQGRAEAKKELVDRHLKGESMREVKKLDKATGKIVSVWEERPRHTWTADTKTLFFERQEQSLSKKDEFVKTLEMDVYGQVGKIQLRKREGEEPEDDPVGAFLSRLDDEMVERRHTQPHRFQTKRQPSTVKPFACR